MLCLFCKKDATSSRSVEHIIPESLGNLKHTLPPGVVCDSCNNYFSREVEKPFLETTSIRLLRFHQGVPSKKGKIPPAMGMLPTGYPVEIYRYLKGPFVSSVAVPPEAMDYFMNEKKGSIIIPLEGPSPSGPVVSRFLAKVALESMALRLVDAPGGVDYLAEEKQLDPIRNHARRGEIKEWPIHVRRIYDSDQEWLEKTGDSVQKVHEHDILYTELGEWYFILALFGMEFTINYGGPEIEGYLSWLKEHNNVSPLYWGKNANSSDLTRVD